MPSSDSCLPSELRYVMLVTVAPPRSNANVFYLYIFQIKGTLKSI